MKKLLFATMLFAHHLSAQVPTGKAPFVMEYTNELIYTARIDVNQAVIANDSLYVPGAAILKHTDSGCLCLIKTDKAKKAFQMKCNLTDEMISKVKKIQSPPVSKYYVRALDSLDEMNWHN